MNASQLVQCERLTASTSLVENCGSLLRRLRESRRLSLERLGRNSSTTGWTIGRQERASKLLIRRSTAIALLNALEEAEPLSDDDRGMFVQHFNLKGFVDTAKRMMDAPGMRLAMRIAAVLKDLPPAEALAVRWAAELADDVGVDRLLEALQGMAAIAGVRLSNQRVVEAETAEVARRAGGSGPRMLVKPPRIEDGVEVQEFVPISKPKPKAPRSIDTTRIPKRG